MADITETVLRRIVVQAEERGLDDLASKYGVLADAQGMLARATELAAQATEAAGRRVLSSGGAYDALRRRIDPVYADLRKLETNIRAVDNAFAQGRGVGAYSDNLRQVLSLTRAAQEETRRLQVIETERAAQVAANSQAMFNEQLGVGAPAATTRGAGFTALREEMERLDAEAARAAEHARLKAEQIGRAFQEGLNASFGIGAGGATSRGATYSALEAEIARLDQIERARAAHTATISQQNIDTLLGVSRPSARSQGATISAFEEMEAMRRSAAELLQQIDPLGEAQKRYSAELDHYNTLAAKGVITQQQLAMAHAYAQQKLDGQTKGMGLAANQLTNLGYQINDVLGGLAMGQSPLTILAQQGPQVAQILGDAPGGIAGGLKSLGAIVTGLLTPFNVTFGAAAALTGAAAYAVYSYRDSLHDLRGSLDGVGRAAGATVDTMLRVSAASATAAGVSVSTAREMAGAYVATGRIGIDNVSRLIGVTRNFALVTGQELPDATQELAKSFADPLKGADALNERFGFLSDRTRELIRTQVEQGNRSAAQRTLLEAMAPSLTQAAERVGALGRAWHGVKTAADNALDSVGAGINRVLAPTLQQQLEEALRRSQGRVGSIYALDTGPRPNDRIEDIQERLRRANQQAMSEARAVEANRQSLRLGEMARELNPAQKALETTTNKLKELRDFLANPVGTIRIDASQARDAVFALERLRSEQEATARAGSPEALAARRGAAFSLSTANMSEFGRSAAEIERRFDELRRSATNERADATLQAARDAEIEALRRRYVQQSSSYSTSVMNVPEQFRDLFLRSGRSTGVDPNLLASIARAESRFDPRVIYGQKLSSAGAGGMMQFMPDTARQYGVDRFDPASSVEGAAKLVADRLAARGGNVAMALADYNWGQGNVNDAMKRNGGRFDLAMLPDETQKYIASILQTTPALAQQALAQRDVNLTLQQAGRELADNEKFLGRNSAALEQANYVRQREFELMRQGIEVSAERRAALQREAAEAVGAQRALQSLVLARDLEFERAQLGRDEIEQRVASRVRPLGLGTDSEMAGQIRINEYLKETKSLAGDALKGFISDLRAGRSATEALGHALDRVLERITDRVLDTAISSLFGAIGGGGGLFGSGAGGVNPFGGQFAANPFGYARGGPIHGPGSGTSDSILARLSNGEYVVNAQATARHRPLLDHINRTGLPGFAEGGPVAALPMPGYPVDTAPLAPTPAQSPIVLQMGDTTIDARGSTMSPAEFSAILEARERNLERRIPMILAEYQEREG